MMTVQTLPGGHCLSVSGGADAQLVNDIRCIDLGIPGSPG